MNKEFNILLRHRVPFLTRGSWTLISVCFLILLLLWFLMLPANESRSSEEMKTAYFILAVPDWIKYLSALAFLSLLVLIPLNLLRLKIPSSLFVFDDHLSIRNERLNIAIQFISIKRIFVNDLTNHLGHSKFRLQIGITYDYDKTLAFLLVNYEDSDKLIESLGNIDPNKFSFYDKKLPAIEDEI